LHPGGTLLASLRPAWFLALLGVREQRWQVPDAVLASQSGFLEGIGWQNWHDGPGLKALFEKSGFAGIDLRGLGALSGIEGDPLAAIARPSQLTDEGRESLARAERAFGASHPDIGRYVMVRARRP